MGVIIHLAYKTATGGGIPSPVDGPQVTQWPFEYWAQLMPLLSAYGVTVAVTPPLTKGASLGAGYDIKDHYDLGSKNQSGRRETRYGSVEQAQKFYAQCYALGMEVYANIVHHHIDGDSGDYVFKYLGADGKTKNGRFPKDKNCFCMTWPNPDTVAGSPDWAFGREFMWNLGFYGDGLGLNGPGYVRRNLADSLNWQTRRLGVDGYFLDDVKGTSPLYIHYLLTEQSMQGKVAFGEYSDGNTGVLKYWSDVRVNNTCGVLDFALRYKISDVLNYNSDIRVVLSEGMCWVDPAKAVTFIDNADTDLSDPVKWNKILGYAMILTFPGYPMIFGKDIYPFPGCYDLLKPILNLIWIHENFAGGDFIVRHADSNILVIERTGYGDQPGLIAGFNKQIGNINNPNDWRAITINTHWQQNTQLHDYTGHAQDDKWTDANQNITIWIPPNDNGKGYVVYAPANSEKTTYLPSRQITQSFYGKFDLDTPGITNIKTEIGKLWCAKGTMLHYKFLDPKADIIAKYNVVINILDDQGNSIDANKILPYDGFYHVTVMAETPVTSEIPFELEVKYNAPRLPIVNQ